LYAWHILPIVAYEKNQNALLAEPTGPFGLITETESFKMLTNDPEARLIINC
jgi:abhydrolase domain-containing protein 12